MLSRLSHYKSNLYRIQFKLFVTSYNLFNIISCPLSEVHKIHTNNLKNFPLPSRYLSSYQAYSKQEWTNHTKAAYQGTLVCQITIFHEKKQCLGRQSQKIIAKSIVFSNLSNHSSLMICLNLHQNP